MRRIFALFCLTSWVALCGLAQASNASKAVPSASESVRSVDAQRSEDPIAEAIRETASRINDDPGCSDQGDHRESQLCAQWKAVDAARDASRYALWTLLVSGIGTILLVWTLWETRANARRELRAYVSVKMVATTITVLLGEEVRFKQEAIAHNGGTTPAYNCVNFANVVALPPHVVERQLALALPIEKGALNGGSVIHANEDLPVEFDREVIIPITQIDQVLNAAYSLYIYGVASYIDTFGIRRRTDYCFELGPEQFRNAYLDSMSKTDAAIPVIWKVARFHNTAT